MILDALFSLFEGIVNTIVGLLPDIDPPDLSGMVAATAPVWDAVGWINKYAPVDQAVIALGLFAAWWLVMYGTRFVIWALTKAHFLGGSS